MSAASQREDEFEHFLRHGKARRPIAGSLLLGLILAFLQSPLPGPV
ncbi:hypothetical protein [Vreelandella azerica]|nr:hypothetical protein [Halomonas azerica]